MNEAEIKELTRRIYAHKRMDKPSGRLERSIKRLCRLYLGVVECDLIDAARQVRKGGK